MALMLLPHWTDGCIASQEGLFFEASGTTPYHFLTAAAMSANSSNPVRELRYTDNNAAVGVPMMQKMGVKYLMVFTEAAKAQADTRSDLELVARERPVEHLSGRGHRHRRAADGAAGGGQRPRRRPARAQPRAGHQLVPEPRRVGGDARRRRARRVAAHRCAGRPRPPDRRRADGARGARSTSWCPSRPSSRWRSTRSRSATTRWATRDLSFDVSQIGVPVLVKVSYFPNWQVEGADGPVPHRAQLHGGRARRRTHVSFHYEASTLGQVAYLLTFVGFGLLVFWRCRGDVRHRSPHPFMVDAQRPSDWTPADPWDAQGADGYGWSLADDDPLPDDPLPADDTLLGPTTTCCRRHVLARTTT